MRNPLLVAVGLLYAAFAVACASAPIRPVTLNTPALTASATPESSLTGYPFPVRTTWVYRRLQYEQAMGDPTRIITATNLITETVVRAEGAGPAQQFLHRQTATLVSASSDWEYDSSDLNWESWYRVDGTRVFSSPAGSPNINTLVYDFPLSVGKSWCPEVPPPAYNVDCIAMGRRTVTSEAIYATPAGTFDQCYEINQDYNSGGVWEWFCNGVGVVARKYDHGGSRFGFEDTLIRFSR